MKTTKLFFMAALALMTAACSNDDNDLTTQQPQKAEGIPFSATITIDNGATTRAITENGTKLETSWAENEKVALIHNGVSDEMTVSSVSGGVATITGTITGSPTGGDAVTIIYPASAADGTTGNVLANVLETQNGTLTGTSGTSIAEKYDVRKGTGTLNATGSSLSGTVSLTNQNAIFKLTLKNIDATADVSATSVKIYNQANTLLTTVTPASGYDKVMYVALPTTATTLKFAVTDGTTNYFNMASGLSLGTNFYQSTIKLATVGDVIMSTGKCAKAGTAGAVAMIAYLGNASDCANGLAIALEDVSSNPLSWDKSGEYNGGKTAAELCSAWNTSKAVTGGTWHFPSIKDWQYMFIGCGSGESYSDPDIDITKSYSDLKDKLSAAGGTALKTEKSYYWSSTEDQPGVRAWLLYFGDGSNAHFYPDFECNDYNDYLLRFYYYVRACLAF